MTRNFVRNALSARLLTVALVVVALLCAGLATFRWANQRSRDSAVATLTVLLRSDRPEVRSAAAIQLQDHGRAGIAPLVRALEDDHEEVFTLASQTIDASISRWQFLPPAEAAERLDELASQLDRCISQLPEERRFVARRWAEQIALWPDRSMDLAHVLDRCESILRQSPMLTEVVVSDAPKLTTTASPGLSYGKDDLAREKLRSPLGYSGPSAPAVPEPIEPAASLLPPEFIATEFPPSGNPSDSVEPAEPQRLVSPQAQPLVVKQLNLTRSRASEPEPPPVNEVAELREQSDLNVMQKLHDLDILLSKAAETELRRRGYRTVDLPICEALVHPDPAVRRRLAESLPSMHNVDARPWLLQLSQDEDSEVRRAADGILRTSQDPALQNRFR